MAKRYSVTEEEYKQIVHQLQETLRGEENIAFAYLHGSFVEKRNFADLDIAVFLHKVPESNIVFYELALEHSLGKIFPYPVEVRILNNAPPSFCYLVLKKGIILVDNNEDARVDFAVQTYRRYFDFLPFRRRYLKEALSGEI